MQVLSNNYDNIGRRHGVLLKPKHQGVRVGTFSVVFVHVALPLCGMLFNVRQPHIIGVKAVSETQHAKAEIALLVIRETLKRLPARAIRRHAVIVLLLPNVVVDSAFSRVDRVFRALMRVRALHRRVRLFEQLLHIASIEIR